MAEPKSLGSLLSEGCGWWALLTAGFFVAFILFAKPLLWLLETVLVFLNNVGSG